MKRDLPAVWPDDPRVARQVLQDSMRKGMVEVLGQSGAEMLLKTHPIEFLAENPLAFHEILAEIFGENGTRIIEKEIGRRLLDYLADCRPTKVKVEGAELESIKVLRRFAKTAQLHRGSRSSKPRLLRAKDSMEATASNLAVAFA